MIKFKSGVSPRGLRPEIWQAVYKCEAIFDQFGVDLVVTSTREGRHSVKRSKHYSGDAADLRSKHLPPHERQAVLEEIKEVLGPDYVVILESPDEPWEHYHVHFGPVYSPTVRYT